MFLFKKKTPEVAPPPSPENMQPPAAAGTSSGTPPPASTTPSTSTIFGIKQQKTEDGDALDALLKGTTEPETKTEQKSVLGAPPRTFFTKPEALPRDFLRLKKTIFQLSVFAAIAATVYFQVQINPQLNIWPDSTVHTFEKEKNALLQTQTEINLANILRAMFAMDAFTTAAANYHSGLTQSTSVAVTSSQQAQALQDAAAAKVEILQSLTTLKMLLPSKFSPSDSSLGQTLITEEDFKNALLKEIQDQTTQIQTSNIATATRDLQRLATATAMINSARLRSTVESITIEEITDDQITELAQVASNLNKNSFATIAAVKENRLTWSSIIHDIEETTKTVDPLHGTYYQGQNVSAVVYNSYSLDSSNGSITLSGSTRTDTSKTFTLIADLIDALEASDQFKNVEMRSFSKTEDEEVGYTANLSLSLELENQPVAEIPAS